MGCSDRADDSQATAVSRGSKDREVGVRCTVISGGDRAAAAAESSHWKHKS